MHTWNCDKFPEIIVAFTVRDAFLRACQHIAGLCSFLRPRNIPLCVYATVPLSIHPSVDIELLRYRGCQPLGEGERWSAVQGYKVSILQAGSILELCCTTWHLQLTAL